MNRDDLDVFFAKAEDVLTNWDGGTDAMRCEPSKGSVDLARGESYYDQREYERPFRFDECYEWTDDELGYFWTPLARTIADDLAAAINRAHSEMIYFGTTAARPQGILGASPDYVIYDEPFDTPDLWQRAIETARERALRLRRERNTGPADPRRLDGRRTRSA